MFSNTTFDNISLREQIRYWGITPSWVFVEEPQTNGVVERYNRTLNEQAIYGRIFRNVEEVRAAVKAFVERYNEKWLIEKMAFRSPAQARREYALAEAALFLLVSKEPGAVHIVDFAMPGKVK